MDSPSVVPDLIALRRCWHPVAFSEQLADQPLRVSLLGEAVVLWRGRDGAPRALSNVCIHRGTALSLGRIVDDELVCPYHGWRYGADGRCTAIPQLADPTRVPGKARVAAFGCNERYGLVWVALEEPRWDLPDVPEFETDGWQVLTTGPYPWAADASRQLENFTDFGHFPWVHPGLLGDPDRPVVPKHTVTVDGHVLRYEIDDRRPARIRGALQSGSERAGAQPQVVRPEASNGDEFPVFATDMQIAPERHNRYRLQLPYTIVLRIGWGGERGLVYLFASQPLGVDACIGYVSIARNYDQDQPAQVFQEFEDTLFDQDKRIVESQRPEHVPFDLADELHLKFDAVAIAYRRAMRAQGLA